MKKHRLHDIVLGMVIMALVMGLAAPAFATVATKTLEAYYMDIKLVVDGVEVVPKDVNGNVVEPFTVNGSTFLPVRAVGEALGKQVTWDGNTKTVYLGEVPEGAIKDWVGTRPLEDLTGGWHDTYSVKDNPAVAAVIKETNSEVNMYNGNLGIRPADAFGSQSIWLQIHDHGDYVYGEDDRLEYWLYGLGSYVGMHSTARPEAKNTDYLKVVKVLLSEIVSDNDDVEAIYKIVDDADKTKSENRSAQIHVNETLNTVIVQWDTNEFGVLYELRIYNKLP